jgi:hypothetical protein
MTGLAPLSFPLAPREGRGASPVQAVAPNVREDGAGSPWMAPRLRQLVSALGLGGVLVTENGSMVRRIGATRGASGAIQRSGGTSFSDSGAAGTRNGAIPSPVWRLPHEGSAPSPHPNGAKLRSSGATSPNRRRQRRQARRHDLRERRHVWGIARQAPERLAVGFGHVAPYTQEAAPPLRPPAPRRLAREPSSWPGFDSLTQELPCHDSVPRPAISSSMPG